MKLTKTKLKQLIVEEITGTREGPFYDAKNIIFTVVQRMRHEERMGRPVIITSRAGEDVNVLEELTQALQWLVEHDQEMRGETDETY